MNKRELQPCPDTYVPSDRPAICPLDSFGLIQVSGDDAETFLQNLSSNDFSAVKNGISALGGICNPKGRMLATFLAIRYNDSYYLAIPREIVDKIVRHLRTFVLMAKVTIEDVSNAMPAIGVIGGKEKSGIADTPVMNIADNFCLRQMIYLRPEAIDTAWQQLINTGYTPLEPAVWHQCDIRSGLVRVLAATSGKLLPQVGNLDLLGGISFSKGCYPGQEIVARMHYLGKLKKRSYVFSTPDNTLTVGDEISRQDSSAACGTIIDFCPGTVISYGLATLGIADHDSPLRASAGSPVTLEPCPYEIRGNSYDPEKTSC